MDKLERADSLLEKLSTSFREFLLEVCSKGYSVLGRTPPPNPDIFNPLQYGSGHPPSYFDRGRYRYVGWLCPPKPYG